MRELRRWHCDPRNMTVIRVSYMHWNGGTPRHKCYICIKLPSLSTSAKVYCATHEAVCMNSVDLQLLLLKANKRS